MRLRSIYKSGAWLRRLRAQDQSLKHAIADTAAEALRDEVARNANLSLSITAEGAKRFVGSVRAEDAAREFGTLEQSASPWLAPVLPLARGPMRAAVQGTVARALSKGNR